MSRRPPAPHPTAAKVIHRASLLVPKNLQARTFDETNFYETLAHLLKAYIGAGLFAMGDGFKNSGLLVGSVGTIFIGLICIYNNHVLMRVARVIKEHKHLLHSPTFPETIAFAFEIGPPSMAKLHRVVMYTMKACIFLTQFGFCVVYIVFVSDTLKHMLEEYVLTEKLNSRLYILMTSPVIVALSLIHSLKFLAPVSALSVVFLLYGFFGLLVVCSLDLKHISEARLVSHISKWPLFFGTVIFAFEGIAAIIPLKNEMKKPNTFDSTCGVMNIGMTVVLAAYFSLGFISFWRYGDEITGSITLNLPRTGVGESIKASVAVGILLSYPLQFYIPTKLIFSDMVRRWDGFKHPLIVELLLRIALVIMTYVLAVAIPHVETVVSFLGALGCNMLALFFPPVADICLRFQPPPTEEPKDDDDFKPTRLTKNCFRLFMDVLTLLLFIVGFSLGIYTSVLDIIEKFKSDLNEEH